MRLPLSVLKLQFTSFLHVLNSLGNDCYKIKIKFKKIELHELEAGNDLRIIYNGSRVFDLLRYSDRQSHHSHLIPVSRIFSNVQQIRSNLLIPVKPSGTIH